MMNCSSCSAGNTTLPKRKPRITSCARAGFTNLNIDLMFGLPTDAAQWEATLERNHRTRIGTHFDLLFNLRGRHGVFRATSPGRIPRGSRLGARFLESAERCSRVPASNITRSQTTRAPDTLHRTIADIGGRRLSGDWAQRVFHVGLERYQTSRITAVILTCSCRRSPVSSTEALTAESSVGKDRAFASHGRGIPSVE